MFVCITCHQPYQKISTACRNMSTDVSAHFVHEGQSGTDESAQALTQKNWKSPALSLNHGCGGGGGIFLVRKDFGRRFNNSFPACAFYIFKWR